MLLHEIVKAVLQLSLTKGLAGSLPVLGLVLGLLVLGVWRGCYYFYAIIWIESPASTVDKRTVDNYRNTTMVRSSPSRQGCLYTLARGDIKNNGGETPFCPMFPDAERSC